MQKIGKILMWIMKTGNAFMPTMDKVKISVTKSFRSWPNHKIKQESFIFPATSYLSSRQLINETEVFGCFRQIFLSSLINFFSSLHCYFFFNIVMVSWINKFLSLLLSFARFVFVFLMLLIIMNDVKFFHANPLIHMSMRIFFFTDFCCLLIIFNFVQDEKITIIFVSTMIGVKKDISSSFFLESF